MRGEGSAPLLFGSTNMRSSSRTPSTSKRFGFPFTRRFFAREWAELASRAEAPCISEAVKLNHDRSISRLGEANKIRYHGLYESHHARPAHQLRCHPRRSRSQA